MTAPTVSVIMAAYNGAAWLPETLQSLAAQTFPDFEVLVVDDCSTDDTRDLVASWPDARVRLIALDANGGPVRARNRAVAEARGRYLAALDQDDLCRPDRFGRQVAYLDAHPDVALLGTNVEFLRGRSIRPSGYSAHTSPALLDWLVRIGNPLAWSSVMVRTTAARALDPFTRPDILYAEDFDLYHRIRPHGRIARLDTPLLLYRQHAGGASQRYTATMEASATRVLADAYAAVFKDEAPARAALIVRHLVAGQPPAGRADLAAVGDTLTRLLAAHRAEHAPTPADWRLIKWETARRWAQVGRAGLRSGSLTLADLVATRPAHLGLGYAGPEALLWSGMIGGARRTAARRRTLAQALAAKIIRPGPSRAKT
ncbi:glycosyltransferase family 2 protein [Sphingomonas carotinifaciens]|uniref:glycosyltransferase family 2 protein n=1 Tax=Sphingomonas carotinifaciens TaxID=1166323 RepID=UPI0039A28DE7